MSMLNATARPLYILGGEAQRDANMLFSDVVIIAHFVARKSLGQHIQYQVNWHARLNHWLAAVDVRISIYIGHAQWMLHFRFLFPMPPRA